MPNKIKLKSIQETLKLNNKEFSKMIGTSQSYYNQIFSKDIRVSEKALNKFLNTLKLNYTINQIIGTLEVTLENCQMESGTVLRKIMIDVPIKQFGLNVVHEVEVSNIYRTPYNYYNGEGELLNQPIKEEPHRYEIESIKINSTYCKETDQEQNSNELNNLLCKITKLD